MVRYYFIYLMLLLSFTANTAVANNIDTNYINGILLKAIVLENNDQDSAYKLAIEANQLSQKLNYQKGLGGSFMRMGSILNTQGKNDKALIYIMQAIEIRKSIKDYSAASGSCVTLSYIYKELGIKDSAFYFLFQSLRFCELTHNPKNLTKTYAALGTLYADYGDTANSYKNFLNAIETADQTKVTDDYIMAYDGLGAHYFTKKNFNKSLEYFLKLDAIIQSNEDDPVARAKNYNNIGLCYNNLEKYIMAKNYYQLALNEYIRLDMPNDIACGYFNLGSMYNNLSKPDSAIYFLNKAVPIARELGDLQRVSKCFEYLADAFALKKDYPNAYIYQVKYTKLNDSLLNVEKINSISEMQTKYDTEKKEQNIALLKEQNKAKSNQRNFFIVGFLLVLLLIGVVVNRYRLKQKSNAALSKTLQELKDTQNQLLQSEKMAAFGAVATRVAHEILNPLNFVNNFSQFSEGLLDDLKGATTDEEKEEIYNDLKSNLQKINNHAKRAGSIVTELIKHTRAGTAHEYFEDDGK